VALANRQDDRVRKEFEKWFILTYSNNRAIINEKKGGDEGIDGVGYVIDYDEKNQPVPHKIIFSVKSGKTLTPSVVRDLYGTMTREGAIMGYLLTLYDMPNIDKEAKKYGRYESKASGNKFDCITVINVQQLLNGERLNLSWSLDVVKSAVVKEGNATLDIFDNL
jgi:site-specific DNA-methyltransferase (adenine-specific)